MADIKPITLDMGGLAQMGIAARQLAVQQGQLDVAQQRIGIEAAKAGAEIDIKYMTEVLKDPSTSPFQKFSVANKLAERTGIGKIDPGEYVKAEGLFNTLVSSIALTGPTSPESTSVMRELFQSPVAPMFKAHAMEQIRIAQEHAKVRGMQSLGTSAAGRPVSGPEAEAISASPQLQTEVGKAAFQSPLEQARMQEVQQRTAHLDLEMGQRIQFQQHVLSYTAPAINLDSELAYRAALPTNDATQTALSESGGLDELATQYGAMTIAERRTARQQVTDDLESLRNRERGIQRELHNARYAIDAPASRGVEDLQNELTAIRAGMAVKRAEQAYWANPTADMLDAVQDMYDRNTGLLDANKKAIAALRDQRSAVAQRSLDVRTAELQDKKEYRDRLIKAQARFGKTDLTEREAARIAAEENVLAEDVLKAGKKQPLAEIHLPQEDATKEAQKEFVKSARSTYDQLKVAPAQLQNLEKARALIPKAKGFMGPGGESLLGAAKFLNNRLGFAIDTEGIKSAEELRSRIFFNIMDNLKKMDAQPSEMQQRLMQDSLGKLGTDPNALASVLNAYEDLIRTKVEQHNREVLSAKEQGVQFPFDVTIDLPPKPLEADERRELERLRKKYGR